MSSKEMFLLEIIINLCKYCDFDIDCVSSFLNKSVFYHYHDFIKDVCNLESKVRVFLNESK